MPREPALAADDALLRHGSDDDDFRIHRETFPEPRPPFQPCTEMVPGQLCRRGDHLLAFYTEARGMVGYAVIPSAAESSRGADKGVISRRLTGNWISNRSDCLGADCAKQDTLDFWARRSFPRITSYNVCYTKLLRIIPPSATFSGGSGKERLEHHPQTDQEQHQGKNFYEFTMAEVGGKTHAESRKNRNNFV